MAMRLFGSLAAIILIARSQMWKRSAKKCQSALHLQVQFALRDLRTFVHPQHGPRRGGRAFFNLREKRQRMIDRSSTNRSNRESLT